MRMVRKGRLSIESGPESPTVTAEPEEECLDAINDYYPPEGGPITLEESIIWSDTVARVRLLSFAGGVEGPNSGGWYAPSFEFTFEAMQYLKGDGGDELVAVASGVPGGLIPGCDASARTEMQRLLPGRDTRWDNLEAIIFLNGQFYEDEHRYRLGYIQQGGQSGYTVDSPYKRAWLPEAPSTGTSGEADQRFLLSAPAFDQSASGQIDALADEPTIGLNEIKLMVARLDSEFAARGGSDLYRHCMHDRYAMPRILRWELEKEGSLVRRRSYYVDSGLSAGSIIWEDDFGIGLPPDKFGRYWLEGQDKDLFTIEAFDPIPATWSWGIPGDLINYSRKVTTTRPLPAGDYEFFFNGFPAYRLLCDVPREIERNLYSEYVKVSGPRGHDL